MANPGWMYHATGGKTLFPDLSPAFQQQLEAEGWRDSPDKLEKKGTSLADIDRKIEVAAAAAPSEPRKTLAELIDQFSADDLKAAGLQKVATAADLVDLGPEKFRDGHEITSSVQALARLGTIIDADGDRADQNTPDTALIAVIDAMSRDELSAVITHLGTELAPDAMGLTHTLRVQLIKLLRPTGEYAFYPGWQGDAVKTEVGEAPADEGQAPYTGPSDGELKHNGPTPDTPLSPDATIEQFRAATPEARAVWVESDGVTKPIITAMLDAAGVVYKDRDAKAALGQQLLDAVKG